MSTHRADLQEVVAALREVSKDAFNKSPSRKFLQHRLPALFDGNPTAGDFLRRVILDEALRVSDTGALFRHFAQTGTLRYILPPLWRCREIHQKTGEERESVLDHSLRVIDGICLLPHLKGMIGAEIVNSLYHPADPDLKMGGIFHDSGKLKTAKFNPKKSETFFPGHEHVSAKIARSWMERLGYPEWRIARVEGMVKFHMFSYPTGMSDEAFERLMERIEQSNTNVYDLLRLRIADRYGNIGKDREGHMPRYFPALLERINRLTAKKIAARKNLVQG